MTDTSDKEKMKEFRELLDSAFNLLQGFGAANELDPIILGAACSQYIITMHKILGTPQKDFERICDAMKSDFKTAKIIHEEEI